MPIQTTPPVPNDLVTAAATFADLPLAKPIVEKLARFSDLDLSKTIAMHIRRPYPNGAFNEQEKNKFTLGLDVFIDLIEQLRISLPEYDKVLLCTNSDETESTIKAYFGEYILRYKKESIDNTVNARAVQDAVVDLTLMSRCPIIFSQETTAFGHFAHVIKNNKFFAVTKKTTKSTFEFWEFRRGVHADSITCPRTDITMLAKKIRS